MVWNWTNQEASAWQHLMEKPGIMALSSCINETGVSRLGNGDENGVTNGDSNQARERESLWHWKAWVTLQRSQRKKEFTCNLNKTKFLQVIISVSVHTETCADWMSTSNLLWLFFNYSYTSLPFSPLMFSSFLFFFLAWKMEQSAWKYSDFPY